MLTIHNNSYVYDGLSSETKPTENIPNGTIFHEIDTGDNYQFNEDATTWVKQPSSGGGGSGGADLPDVTAADNGKVLGVVSGEWDKMDAPDGLPSVTTTDSGKTLQVNSSGEWATGLNIIEHDYTVTYADDTTATLKNVEVV